MKENISFWIKFGDEYFEQYKYFLMISSFSFFSKKNNVSKNSARISLQNDNFYIYFYVKIKDHISFLMFETHQKWLYIEDHDIWMIFIISKWILSKLRIEFQYGTHDDILSTYTIMIIIILDDKIK